MSLEEIRTKSRQLEVYRRRVGWAILPISVLFTLFGLIKMNTQITLPDKGIQVAATGFMAFLAYVSVSLIRARTTPPDAGLKTSVDAYRTHFEWERTMFPRVFGGFGLLTVAVNAGLWIGKAFSTRDVLESLSGGALLGIVIYIAYRHNRSKLNREFRMLDSLETEDEPKL